MTGDSSSGMFQPLLERSSLALVFQAWPLAVHLLEMVRQQKDKNRDHSLHSVSDGRLSF